MNQVKSPQLYIDFGFYYIIAACLQRRVWMGPPEKPLFPNLYITLVGGPGVGKGLVIKEVTDILRHWQRPKILSNAAPTLNIPKQDKDGVRIEKLADNIQDLAKLLQEQQEKNNTKSINNRERLLIPVGADSTTFQALLDSHAFATIRNRVTCCPMAPNGSYSHQSICFSLEELGSLFTKHKEELVNYLQTGYDCRRFEYSTRHSGDVLLHKPCINLFAGTTPSFMAQAFDSAILNQGIASRMTFVYAKKPRREQYGLLQYTDEQKAQYKELLNTVKILADIFGQVTWSTEAWEFNQNYFCKEFPPFRDDAPAKLQDYYSRKDITHMKLCMVLHFSDYEYHKSFEVPLWISQLALKILEEVEKVMTLALTLSGASKIPKLGELILALLKERKIAMPLNLIWFELFKDIKNLNELNETIEGLKITGQIEEVKDKSPKYKLPPIV